jgi:hypothetical protein
VADTDLAPPEELEPSALPEEGAPEAVSEPEGTEQPANPIEALASELGWSPKDQFRGKPEDWKPADEFIRAGRDIQRTVSRELKDVRSTLDTMSRTTAQILQDRLAAQKTELEAKWQDAFDRGDNVAARQLGAQIAQIEAAPAQPAHAAPPTQEGQNFAQRHAAWYGRNSEATNYALHRAQHYADQGLSPARQIAAVEQDMRPIFPDLFQPAQQGKPAPQVRPPQGRTATTSARQKGFADLPPEAQKVAKDMADRGVIPNVEVYATNFFAQAERKVG